MRFPSDLLEIDGKKIAIYLIIAARRRADDGAIRRQIALIDKSVCRTQPFVSDAPGRLDADTVP